MAAEEDTMVTIKPALEQWKTTAQAGELDFHINRKMQPNETLEELNQSLFEGFGFTADQLAGNTVVDVGAGSHLRTKFFKNARIVAVEPLADSYMNGIDWCELADADVVHAVAAEAKIEDLVGEAELVTCINVLDHTYDPGAILDNIHAYLSTSGRFLLSVDLHGETSDGMHPVELTLPNLVELAEAHGFVVERGYMYLPYQRSYGHGDAVTLILRRRDVDEPTGQPVRFERLRSPLQLIWEAVRQRSHSICRRVKRVFTGESRTVKRFLRKAA
jgi:hypothetical protein